jgi:uncharacterized membrane protein SpoIIM required for sporulation
VKTKTLIVIFKVYRRQYGGEEETARHLFLHCRFAAAVWYALNRWLGGVVVVLPGEVLMSYGMLVGSGRNKKVRKGFSGVWLAFVWVIWKTRNDRIFKNLVGTAWKEGIAP